MAEKKKLKYVAVCIGINDYENYDELTGAVHDASAIADVFQELGYDVIRLMNNEATHKAYLALCDSIENDYKWNNYDAIILYFAGHGFMTNLSDCLVLKDTIALTATNNLRVKENSINVQGFINIVRETPIQTVVVIVDACRTDISNYADSKRGSVIMPAPGVGAGIRPLNQAFIAYSTSTNTETDDEGGADGHSPYTAALLEEIKNEIPIELIFKNVRRKVHLKDGDQLPWEYTCLKTDFYFNYGQLDPYYDAEYSKEAFIYSNYKTDNSEAQHIIEYLKSGDADAIENSLKVLLSKKNELGEEDLFVIGRYIYQNATKGNSACRQYLISQTVKLFGNEVNHLLRGILYEIYFDAQDQLRGDVLGKVGVLAIVDNLYRMLKNDDAAKFIKKHVEDRDGNFNFEIWDTTSMLNVEVVSEEMYCSDEHDNLIYGVRNVVVDGEEILPKLQIEIQKVVTKDEIRHRIAETLSIPSRRLKIKGLENEGDDERHFMMFYVDEIEQELWKAITYNLPDEIVCMSSNSTVDVLYAVTIFGISYDGNVLTLEGSCKVDIQNEMDHEEMPGCTLPCDFVAELSYDSDTNSFIIDEGDFTVDTRSYYSPDLFEE